MRSAKAAEARAGLGALEKDAASKGFLLIARRGHPVSAPREGFPPPQLRGLAGRARRPPVQGVNNRQARVLPKTPVASLAASFADHLQARDAQIAGLIVAGGALRVPLFRISRLRFVGYEAADTHLMPEVPAKLNGAAA